ncbi:MAG: hypothetical protein KDB14_07650 [Planctomycetales bacterium]|nr:hypothetical protein [Planctomycetales bacterium]
MSTQRAALLTKAHKVLKKHYKPVAPASSYSVLEHMLYACCLEGAKHEAAEEAYAILQQKYFDWNEVRVTAIGELTEVLSALPDPAAAAKRVRGVLQSLFEQYYSFDLEPLRKQNQGKSIKELSQHRRITPFVVNYLVQCGFGGHSIPLSDGSFEVLYIIGAISEKDWKERKAPGLERTIPKKQGVEFGSLLHQLGTDYNASRHSTRVRAILLEIAPDCKDRLPKRGGKREDELTEKPDTTKAAKAKSSKPAKPETAAPSEKAVKKATKKAAAKTEPPAKTAKPKPEKETTAAKKTTKKTTKASAAKPGKASKSTKKGTAKKSPTSRLAKRKPR